MKKWIKAMSVLLLSAMFISPVHALPSQSVTGIVVGHPIIDGVERKDIFVEFKQSEKFSMLSEKPLQQVNAINAGAAPQEVLGAELDLQGYKLLTKIEDMWARYSDTGEHVTIYNAQVTWEVVSLSEELQDIKVLHYSEIRNVWEILTPDQVNFENKTVSVTFPDLSPIAILYKDKVTKEEHSGNVLSPTGDMKTTMMIGSIGLLSVAGLMLILVTRKKNKEME